MYFMLYSCQKRDKIQPLESFAMMGDSNEEADNVREKAEEIAISTAKTMADNETENERSRNANTGHDILRHFT